MLKSTRYEEGDGEGEEEVDVLSPNDECTFYPEQVWQPPLTSMSMHMLIPGSCNITSERIDHEDGLRYLSKESICG